MALNTFADLKARLPETEHDFKGRPFLTEERLNNDKEAAEFFDRTRASWERVTHTNSFKLKDSINVR